MYEQAYSAMHTQCYISTQKFAVTTTQWCTNSSAVKDLLRYAHLVQFKCVYVHLQHVQLHSALAVSLIQLAIPYMPFMLFCSVCSVCSVDKSGESTTDM